MHKRVELQFVSATLADAGSIDPRDLMIRRLETIGAMTDIEKRALKSLAGIQRDFRAYEDIVREGEKPNAVCLIATGLACRYKVLLDGERQIMAFHVPGSVPDTQGLFLDRMDHNIGTLAPSSVLFIPHSAMLTLFQEHPGLGYLFWRSTLIEAAIYREWMVGLGRRNAYSRLAHLLCEIMMLMKLAGLETGNACELPLTQAELGDATGMSTVHVNRTLQELRARNLIAFKAGSLTILDWAGLVNAGEFDPAYLHLRGTGDAVPRH
jgi:CRP-like cAMP-binding protein